MATRVIKTGSTSKEFAQSPQPWRIADLDTDLDAIFGSIDDTNVTPAAGIQGSKLAAGTVTATQLGPGSVTTPKILDANVTTAKIADLNVTTPKLAINATQNNVSQVVAGLGVVVGAADTVLATMGPFTPRGGRVLIMGTISGRLTLGSSASTLTVKVKRDGSSVTVWVMDLWQAAVPVPSIPFAFPVNVVDLPSAVAHTWTVTAAISGAAAAWVTDGGSPGTVIAIELA